MNQATFSDIPATRYDLVTAASPHMLSYYECGICEHLHAWAFLGDCRQDDERLTLDEVPLNAEIFTWEERLAADEQ